MISMKDFDKILSRHAQAASMSEGLTLDFSGAAQGVEQTERQDMRVMASPKPAPHP